MKSRSHLSVSALAAVLALGSSLGCGAEFDPASELKTLRVLAVKKSQPYAQPGDDVTLSLHWEDGSPDAPRPVQRGFIGGCVNPPGDLYYGCFAQYGEALANGQQLPFGLGDTFDVSLPEDIISGRGGPFEPGQARYGLYIVFFIVCAGTIDIATDIDPSSTALPLRCLDDDGQPLGSRDFVVGYSSIYSFEGASNANPIVTDTFTVEGQSVAADCVGEACQGAEDAPEIDCEGDGAARCIEACEDDGDASCPSIEVQPNVSRESAEVDTVSSQLFGTTVGEQMWINYYVDRGGISDVRLLNDTTTGWNEEYRARLRAPSLPGPMKVWAVVHDNRGGMELSRLTLHVQ